MEWFTSKFSNKSEGKNTIPRNAVPVQSYSQPENNYKPKTYQKYEKTEQPIRPYQKPIGGNPYKNYSTNQSNTNSYQVDYNEAEQGINEVEQERKPTHDKKPIEKHIEKKAFEKTYEKKPSTEHRSENTIKHPLYKVEAEEPIIEAHEKAFPEKQKYRAIPKQMKETIPKYFNKPCRYYLQGNCMNPNCLYLHSQENKVVEEEEEKPMKEFKKVKEPKKEMPEIKERRPVLKEVKVAPPTIIEPIKKTDLKNTKLLEGKCLSMCTPEEIESREAIGDYSIFEADPTSYKADSRYNKINPSFAIKKYERSAADKKMDDANIVRPPDVIA